MARPYRISKSLDTLRAEINRRWPKRDKGSDGWIGDAAHASRSSDHNPFVVVDGKGVVRALDVDRDLDPNDSGAMRWLVEHLRMLGALGDKRLSPTGYIIFDAKIVGAGSTRARWDTWRAYHGTNSHKKHAHVSNTLTPGSGGFDSVAPWGLDGSHALQPTAASVFNLGATGVGVEFIQAALTWLAPYRLPKSGKGIGARVPATGIYDAFTAEAVREFQRWNNHFLVYLGRKPSVVEDGIAGPATLQLMSDWTNVVFKR